MLPLVIKIGRGAKKIISQVPGRGDVKSHGTFISFVQATLRHRNERNKEEGAGKINASRHCSKLKRETGSEVKAIELHAYMALHFL